MGKLARPKNLKRSSPSTIRMTESFHDCWTQLAEQTGLYKIELFEKAMEHTYGIKKDKVGEYHLPKVK